MANKHPCRRRSDPSALISRTARSPAPPSAPEAAVPTGDRYAAPREMHSHQAPKRRSGRYFYLTWPTKAPHEESRRSPATIVRESRHLCSVLERRGQAWLHVRRGELLRSLTWRRSTRAQEGLTWHEGRGRAAKKRDLRAADQRSRERVQRASGPCSQRSSRGRSPQVGPPVRTRE